VLDKGIVQDRMSVGMPSDLQEPSPAVLLKKARQLLTQKELAARLDVSSKTISRWQNGATPCPKLAGAALKNILEEFNRPNGASEPKFTFVDLFAGIGGMRLGFESIEGRCVFTSEWNQWAKRTYLENHSNAEPFIGDIVNFPAAEIPRHDVLLAGFPCQPFSIAGVSKKNALGKPHGFECTTQGTLFFDVARILAHHKPKAFLLENVKNLESHDGGKTFARIREVLEKELKYDVHFDVIDARHFVPQHRERIFMVGFREKMPFNFDDMRLPNEPPVLRSILHPEDGSERPEEPYTTGPKAQVHRKYVLTNKLWSYLRAYAEKHRKAGNGFGFGLVDNQSVARTLSARYYKDGSEILVRRGRGRNPRRLTPRECARLMGYPATFRIPVSDTQAYKQFGNSVAVPVVGEIARLMEPNILALKRLEETGTLELDLFGSLRAA
jgi:DNA (cytosine-5)-methyltransferase 1